MANYFPADLMDLANISAADLSDDSAAWDANSILQGTLLDPALTSTPISTPPPPRTSSPSATGVGVGSSSPRPGPSGVSTNVGVGTPASNTVRTTTVGRLPSGKRIPTGRPAPRISVGKQPRNHSAAARGRGRGRGRGRPRGTGRRTISTGARQATASRTVRAAGRGRGRRRTRMTQAELRRQLDLLSQDQV